MINVMMKRLMANQKGMLLAWVLILLAVLSILIVAALTLVMNQTMMSTRFSSSVKAFHYAEAGIHHYLAYLNSRDSSPQAPPPFNEDIPYEGGFYRLELIDGAKSGETIIRSTGWLQDPAKGKDDLRTVDALLRKRSFTEYVYFSDDDGANIYWMSGEKCLGPYHTNTILRVQGRPIFYGPVSYVQGIHYSSGSNPDFRQGTTRVAPIVFPTTNTELYNLALLDGYVFYGRTSIMLNADGTITVRNKDVNHGNPETRQLPNNGVIYVTGSSADQNGKFAPACGNVFVSGELKGRLTIAASNDIYITGKDPTEWIPLPPQVSPQQRQWYFDNVISSTGGIRYAGTTFNPVSEEGELVGYNASGNDMLGLVSNNSIWILTSGWFAEDGNHFNIWSYPPDLTIHAAVFAINQSFGNENTNVPPRPGGKLTLRGALIQNKRAAVGRTTGTGYHKDYAHDDRMIYDAPPHFLAPAESGWMMYELSESSKHVNGNEDE